MTLSLLVLITYHFVFKYIYIYTLLVHIDKGVIGMGTTKHFSLSIYIYIDPDIYEC
jgi:hypothetical protein